MRKIKTIDDITKDGKVEFGEGYEPAYPSSFSPTLCRGV